MLHSIQGQTTVDGRFFNDQATIAIALSILNQATLFLEALILAKRLEYLHENQAHLFYQIFK